MKENSDSFKFTQKHTNICKGIAIILMYIHHLFGDANAEGMDRVVFNWLSAEQWVAFGQICKICVAIFVFLTAYGTSLQIENGKVGEAASVRRYKKLLMGFWVIYVDSQIVSLFVERTRISVYGSNIIGRWFYTILDSLGLARAFGTPTYNATWWYMSFAVILIFIIPMLYKVVETWGVSVLVLIAIVPRMAGMDMSTYFWWYIFTVILGIYCAQNHIFGEIYSCMRRIPVLYYCGWVIVAGLLYCLIFIRKSYGYASTIDGLVAFCICYLVYAYLEKIKFINVILECLGKHSMNMFLIHTFIKTYFLNEWTYSFKYPILIIGVLILDTLAISILIEIEKKFLGLIRKVIQHPHHKSLN